MKDMHLGALELTLIADNWSAPVTVCSAIDARIVNSGAKLYRKFNNKHIEPLQGQVIANDAIVMTVRTSQSHVNVTQAARTQVMVKGKRLDPPRRVIEEPGYIGQEFCVDDASKSRAYLGPTSSTTATLNLQRPASITMPTRTSWRSGCCAEPGMCSAFCPRYGARS
jgi:hypothetical protein